MGWKTLKEHFGIEHIVKIEGDQVLIGSPYIGDLGVIDIKTGKLSLKDGWERSLEDYPALRSASPAEILDLLRAPDHFNGKTCVYIVSDAKVYEDYCEKEGYPNVTYSGRLMYQNTTFLSLKDAQTSALKSLEYRVKSWEERKRMLLKEVEDLDAEIVAAREAQNALSLQIEREGH